MVKHTVVTGVVVGDHVSQISFLDICHHYAIPEDMLLELLEYGLISEIVHPTKETMLTQQHLQRILSAHRLQQDLEVNIHGAILALELMDEVKELQRQLDILRRHME